MTLYAIKDKETGKLAGLASANSLVQLTLTVEQLDDPSFYEAKELHCDQGEMVFFDEGEGETYSGGWLEQIRIQDGWIDLCEIDTTEKD